MLMDIGAKGNIILCKDYLEKWNNLCQLICGVYENRNFTKGTKKICEATEKPKDYRVIRFISVE